MYLKYFAPPPPDPDSVTPQAYEICVSEGITPQELYAHYVSTVGYRAAFAKVWPPTIDQEFQAAGDLEGYVNYRRYECGWPLEKIAVFAKGLFGKGSAEYIRRLTDPEAAEKFAEYRAEWRERNREHIREYDKAYYHANRERIAKRRKELRDAKKNK
jgi:hypothetical protein